MQLNRPHVHRPVDGAKAGGRRALQAMAAQGITLNYDRIHAVYDLFRVEHGKIAEHWDTIETIPPRDQWKNQNGKFGFA